MAFYQGNCALGERKWSENHKIEKKKSLLGIADTDSDLTLILRNPKCHFGPPVKVGAYGGQLINEVLA